MTVVLLGVHQWGARVLSGPACCQGDVLGMTSLSKARRLGGKLSIRISPRLGGGEAIY